MLFSEKEFRILYQMDQAEINLEKDKQKLGEI